MKFIFFIIILIFSLFLGKYNFSSTQYFEYFLALITGKELENFQILHTILLDVRLPRILACILIGASLATSGAVYQAIFANPLVSPSILGVLAGAGFGTGLAMLFDLSQIFIQISTFSFGLLAVLLSIFISLIYSKQGQILILVIGGIISGSLFSALLMALKYLADPTETLQNYIFFNGLHWICRR